ncbi:MAG: GNAT family N-acetyltransferase [Anaerolineae bacterium]|jgi:GNAT superfamily N-acetyltransferase|nr:GNAT family N-acetyltransferase [Anaerolineae bacterium]MBT7073006.1 GNAT family N-acetyltransferase [Anaerolineae bacterium]MBT7325286.1 GNAT family N-acetyltransferase [Anaerolineae bacterium]
MEVLYQDYLITDDKKLISPQAVKTLLDGSYWAPDRSIELIEKTIRNSICVGVFDEEELVAFARVVTDKAVFAWIADVIVNEAHRGKGVGKEIVQFIQDHPDIPAHSQLLRTRDAHGLYERYGFSKNDNIMSK